MKIRLKYTNTNELEVRRRVRGPTHGPTHTDFEILAGPIQVGLTHQEFYAFLHEALAILPNMRLTDGAWDELMEALR